MNTTSNNRVIPITDHRGGFLVPEMDLREPEPGSVALTQGMHGTAWQRHFSDGLWHCTLTGRKPKTWEWLLGERNLVLVYDADERSES